MENSGFFDTKVNEDGSYDRAYLASSFAAYFASFIGNGVFANKLNTLQVVAGTNMTIKVKSGQGWINGYWYENTDDLPLTIQNADGIYNRYDSVVLQLSFIDRIIRVIVKTGMPASAAQPPALVRNADYYELALAYIYVPKGTTSVLQQRINDKRPDATVCGFVTGVVDQIDTSEFYTQLDGFIQSYINKSNNTYNDFKQFLDNLKESGSTDKESFNAALDELSQEANEQVNALIDEIRGLLDGDVATNLQNQIDKINGELAVAKYDIGQIKADVEPIKGSYTLMSTGDVQSEYRKVLKLIPGHSYCLIAYIISDVTKKITVAKRRLDYNITNEMLGSYGARPVRCIEKTDQDARNFIIPGNRDYSSYDIVSVAATSILDFSYFYEFKQNGGIIEVDENNYAFGLANYDGLADSRTFFDPVRFDETDESVDVSNPIEFPVITLKVRAENGFTSKNMNIIVSDITDKDTIIPGMDATEKISRLERHNITYTYAMALMALEGIPKMSLADSTSFILRGTKTDGSKIFTDYGFSILIFRNIEHANDLSDEHFDTGTFDMGVITDQDVKESLGMPQQSVDSLFGRLKLIWSAHQTTDTKTLTVYISVNQNWAEPPDPSEYTVVIREYQKTSPYTSQSQDGNWFKIVQG